MPRGLQHIWNHSDPTQATYSIYLLTEHVRHFLYSVMFRTDPYPTKLAQQSVKTLLESLADVAQQQQTLLHSSMVQLHNLH